MADTQEDKDRRRIEAYQKELDADPKSLAFVALSEAFNRLGDWDRAVDTARAGLAHHPGSVAGHLACAVGEAGRGKIREALEAIKAALIIDQENPRALALMGSLLLQKGLAHRATQFLTQAVRLAPDSREYADLLKRAKRIAKSEKPLELPAIRGSQVQEPKSPWAPSEGDEATEYQPSGEERTVFAGPDSDAGGFDAAPTHFAEDLLAAPGSVPPPRKLQNAPVQGSGPKNGAEGAPGQKPKVGGSAAEYSQMMKSLGRNAPPPPEEQATVAAVDRAQLDVKDAAQWSAAVPDDPRGPAEEHTVYGKGGDSNKPVSAPSPKPASKPASSAPIRSEPPAAAPKSEPKPAPKAPSTPKAEAAPAPAKEEKPAKPPKAEKAEKAAPRPAEPLRPWEERPATMMVDDAIWAIYGGAPPGQSKDEPAKAAPEPARAKAKAAPEEADEGSVERPAGAMVVRTSAGLANFAFWMLVVVLAGAATWLGYSFALGRSGSDVSGTSEELRSLASDLERGGLASLRSAEEAIAALSQSSPDLEALLTGVLAEVHAEMWASFGRDPARRQRAQAELASLTGKQPTVEMLAASIVLSTATATSVEDREAWARALETFPRSPKAWILRARLAAMSGEPTQAQRDLFAAYALNPRRRGTLMALARWHAESGAPAAAFRFFDELQELEPNDIEALLERYVLGKLTGLDPAANDTASRLSGLVREESKTVAKDETGRAALVFSVTDFVRGDLDAGLEGLSLAANAFPGSPEYRRTVGAFFLVLGERDLAKQHLEASMKLEASDETRLWLARLSFAERAGLKRRPEAAAALKKRQAEKSSESEVELEFGRVRLGTGRFSLVEVEPNPAVFPEAEYRARSGRATGDALARTLEVANLFSLAMRTRDRAEARDLLEDARKLADDGLIEVALGRLLLEAKDLDGARRAFKAALVFDDRDPAARIGLAETLVAQGEVVSALDILEPLVQSNVVAPKAYRLIARIKSERGDDKGALELLDKAAAVSGGASPSMLIELGRLRHRAQETARALDAYQHAVAADSALEVPPPKGSAAESKPVDHYYIGQVLAAKGEWARAAEHLQRAKAAEEQLPVELSFHLGRALYKTKKTKKQGRKALEGYLRSGKDEALKEQATRLLKAR